MEEKEMKKNKNRKMKKRKKNEYIMKLYWKMKNYFYRIIRIKLIIQIYINISPWKELTAGTYQTK